MTDVSAEELRRLAPKQFEKEYNAWLVYAHDYDWWDAIECDMREQLSPKGLRLDKVLFSLSYSQSDYAAFNGRIDVAMWMQAEKYDEDRTYAEAFPALYLAAKQDGSYCIVDGDWRKRSGVDYCCAVEYTDPDGVFQHLDEDTWHGLVVEQELECRLEEQITEWVHDQCDNLYSMLRKEYESISSEDAFIESCLLNEVTFEIEEANCEMLD